MLVPAVLYKDELTKEFEKELYTENFFYYNCNAYCNTLPEIIAQDNSYQYAIVNSKKKLIGYLSYWIDSIVDTVYAFNLYSFDKGNFLIGKDIFEKLNELIKNHHRIEWRMVDTNPVKKHYDKFCHEHNGYITVLHDLCKDIRGAYHDMYVYEIISK